MCNPYQICASLTLKDLPLSYVVSIAAPKLHRGVSAPKARSSPNFIVNLTFLTLLRVALLKS